MRLSFHRRAEEDLAAILSHYEREGGPVLARRFFDEFEKIIGAVETRPEIYRVNAAGLKRANLTRFPFHILFLIVDSEIRVLVIRHHRRRPTFGRNRR